MAISNQNSQKVHNYNIKLSIKGVDISTFVKRFKISNDLDNVYTNIVFSISMDFKQFAIDNKLYGTEELVFRIEHLDVEKNVIDTYAFILSIVESNLSLVVHNIDAYENPNPKMDNNIRQDIVLVTLPIIALNRLGVSVNYVSNDDEEKTPFEFLKQIITNTGAETKYLDARNQNTQKLRQLCIPPLSVNKMIQLMNTQYGIYKGPLFYFCDGMGFIRMWDMRTRFKKDDPVFVVHHYAIDNSYQNTINEEIQKLIGDLTRKEGNFMSVTPIDILKTSNADVIDNGYYHFSLFHPPYDLYGSSLINTKDLIKDSGLVDKNTEYQNNKLLEFFKRNYFQSCNEVVDDTLIKANITNKYSLSSPIRIKVRGYCRFSFFLQVGVPCDLMMYTTAYKDYAGRYILGKSTIDVTRVGHIDWKTSVKLILYRSV